MTPATIMHEAQADGVTLALSPAGTIKVTGDGAAVNRWLDAIRQHKAEIIEALDMSGCWLIHYPDRDPLVVHCSPDVRHAEMLAWYPGALDAAPYTAPVRRPFAPMTGAEEAVARAWLARIGDRDPVSIADIIDACQRDADARRYFMGLAAELAAKLPPPKPAESPATARDSGESMNIPMQLAK